MTTLSRPRPPGILIADDEETICFSLSRELRRRGMTVFVAPDGSAALQLFVANSACIDAVFLDVRMPRLDGWRTLAALNRLVPGIRCCLMTAFQLETVEAQSKGIPKADILTKPFDLAVFVQVAERLLAPNPANLSEPRCIQGHPLPM